MCIMNQVGTDIYTKTSCHLFKYWLFSQKNKKMESRWKVYGEQLLIPNMKSKYD